MWLLLGMCVSWGQNEPSPEFIVKEFIPAGRIEALIDGNESAHHLLVQLDLKNDSLLNIVNTIILWLIRK